MNVIRTRTALAMLAPAVLVYLVLVIYPLIRGLSLSLTDSTGLGEANFVGLDNYARMLSDPQVPRALGVTVVFTAMVVVVQNAMALALAAVLNRHPRVRNAARIGLLVPAMLSVVVVGYVWSYIYSPLDGPLNLILESVGLSNLTHVWLAEEATALPAIAVANIWMYVGYSMTIYLSNYLSIPAEMFEAAALDGAGPWARFWQVELPLLAPSITVNLALTTIGTLRVFEFPLVMTQGGPANATQSLTMLLYERAFYYYEFGYGAAIAVVLLVLTLTISIVQVAVLRRREALI